MKITKQLLKDLKTADAMVIRFTGKFSTLDLFYKQPNSPDRVITYQYGDSLCIQGSWHTSLYPSMHTEQGCLLALLRVGDDLQFNPRYNGSTHTEELGINVQELIFTFKRYKKDNETLSKYFSVIFDSQICPTNSALYITSGIKVVNSDNIFHIAN